MDTGLVVGLISAAIGLVVAVLSANFAVAVVLIRRMDDLRNDLGSQINQVDRRQARMEGFIIRNPGILFTEDQDAT